MGEDDIDIFQTQSLQGRFSALNNTKFVNQYAIGVDRSETYCFLESPVSLGPASVPKKILVVMMRSERRMSSSRMARPLT
jgi:hypothetical protein